MLGIVAVAGAGNADDGDPVLDVPGRVLGAVAGVLLVLKAAPNFAVLGAPVVLDALVCAPAMLEVGVDLVLDTNVLI